MGLISRVSSRTYRSFFVSSKPSPHSKMLLKNIALSLFFLTTTYAELVNKKVTRKINLEKHYTKIDSSVTILNTGDKPKSRIQLLPDPSLSEELSTFLVYLNGQSLWVDPSNWEAQLPNAVENEGTVDLTIEEIYTHTTTPFPTKIKQTQDQFMKYNGNLHHYSPYETKISKISVSMPSTKINSYEPRINGAKRNGRTINYGPFKDLPKNQKIEMNYHFLANIPYLTTHYLLRQIEVSHWGNVNVRDNADVRNIGAKLVAKLPVHAKNVIYRDAIGNISTSSLSHHKDRVNVELRPRTPLFGGWKSEYTLGFNLPSEKALFYSKKDNSKFTLKLKAIDQLYKDQVIDQVEIQIILPEGAQNINVKTPAGYQRAHDEVIFTYLDMHTGRPVIKLRADNLAGKSLDQNLQVTYNYSRISIIREPLMTICFFGIFFIFVMFIVRLDFTIGDDGSGDLKARITAAYMIAQEANKKRNTAQNAYEKALNRYKETKDLSILSTQQKALKAECNSFKRTIGDVILEHKEVVGDKMNEIGGLCGSYNEAVQKGDSGLSKVKEIDGKINAIIEN